MSGALAGKVAVTVAEFGGIDILVANAGVLWLGPIESTPLKRWKLCLDVNTTGVFLVTRAVIPHVRARGGGSLIAVTTTGVAMTDHGANAYWVSKAATERLYLGLAADLKPDNIAVNFLSPSRAGGAGCRRRHRNHPALREPHRGIAFLAVVSANITARNAIPRLRGGHPLAIRPSTILLKSAVPKDTYSARLA